MIVIRFWALAALIGLIGCAAPDTQKADAITKTQLNALLPADAILLGEQHDAPDHQRIHQLTTATLTQQNKLAALVLEMANAGQSTERLAPNASEDQVRAALQWEMEAWPWAAYSPAVMTAVRAGVPVLGANLPRTRLKEAMTDTGLDARLPAPAFKEQQQNIREGHCELLPESQISPMTRIQIARDVSIAHTLLKATRPGKTVLLLAGGGHVNRLLGVPLHLPPDFMAKSVLLTAESATAAIKNKAEFDQFWFARPAPVVDYCADFTAQRARQQPATIQ